MPSSNCLSISAGKGSMAEQAIKDLVARGFKIVSPLKQENPQSEVLHNLTFEQRRFPVEDFSSPWIAKLMRIVQ
ncbi:hypothetical protein [Peribacillus frigoritolerans]